MSGQLLRKGSWIFPKKSKEIGKKSFQTSGAQIFGPADQMSDSGSVHRPHLICEIRPHGRYCPWPRPVPHVGLDPTTDPLAPAPHAGQCPLTCRAQKFGIGGQRTVLITSAPLPPYVQTCKEPCRPQTLLSRWMSFKMHVLISQIHHYLSLVYLK